MIKIISKLIVLKQNVHDIICLYRINLTEVLKKKNQEV